MLSMPLSRASLQPYEKTGHVTEADGMSISGPILRRGNCETVKRWPWHGWQGVMLSSTDRVCSVGVKGKMKGRPGHPAMRVFRFPGNGVDVCRQRRETGRQCTGLCRPLGQPCQTLTTHAPGIDSFCYQQQ